MTIGVICKSEHKKNGLDTFERELTSRLKKYDEFELIHYPPKEDRPFGQSLRSREVKKAIKSAGKYDKILLTSQEDLVVDQSKVNADLVPYVHDILPVTTKFEEIGSKSLIERIFLYYSQINSYKQVSRLSNCKQVLTASNVTKEEISQRTSFGGKSNTVYQGLDDMPILESEFDRDIDLLYVGSLHGRKNPSFIYNVFQEAKNKGFNVVSVNFSEIDLPGKNYSNVSDRKLAELYSRSNFYLHSSYAEGFGRPPVEAQKYGATPLALDNEINHEVLGEEGESWLLIDSIDEVVEIIKNEEKLPENNLNSNTSRFRWDKTAQEIRNLLI